MPLDISVSADRHTLYVCGRAIYLAAGKAPDFIPTSACTGAAEPVEAHKNEPVTPAKEEHNMATTVEELMQENPDLTNQMLADARTAAVNAEQQRLRDIDEVSGLFDDEMVREAKYGEHACDAKELTYRAAQAAAKQGRKFLAGMEDDASASGTAEVPAATPTKEEAETTNAKNTIPEQRMAAARAAVAKVMHDGKASDRNKPMCNIQDIIHRAAEIASEQNRFSRS